MEVMDGVLVFRFAAYGIDPWILTFDGFCAMGVICP